MNLTLEEYEKLNPRSEIEHEGARMIFATPSTETARGAIRCERTAAKVKFSF